MARTKAVDVPEVGDEAPEFNLPSAQGGQLRLSMRTARGPVVVVFYEGPTEEEAAYFRGLAAREDEINMAGGSVVGIGVAEPSEARRFVEETGLKSYVLYDYARTATRGWGLLEKSRDRGGFARPAAFVVDGDGKVAHAWVGERPEAAELLAKVSEITGLPKEPAADDEQEKPKRAARKGPGGEAEGRTEAEGAEGGAAAEKPKKMSAEERERIKAERRAARESGKSLKTAGDAATPASGGASDRQRLSPEEREKRRAERRAARDAAEKGGTGEPVAPEAGKEGAGTQDATGEAPTAKPDAQAAGGRTNGGDGGSEGETKSEPEGGAAGER